MTGSDTVDVLVDESVGVCVSLRVAVGVGVSTDSSFTTSNPVNRESVTAKYGMVPVCVTTSSKVESGSTISLK